jgi:hypothetical protein
MTSLSTLNLEGMKYLQQEEVSLVKMVRSEVPEKVRSVSDSGDRRIFCSFLSEALAARNNKKAFLENNVLADDPDDVSNIPLPPFRSRRSY